MVKNDPIRIEQLEYGKLCTTPDGPAERMECAVLTRSVGWNDDLEALCRPWVMGLGVEDVDETSEMAHRHGTVVRAATNGNGPVQFAYRLRRRHEDGEEGKARTYWLGRYLMNRVATPPSGLLSLLDYQPLDGVTRQETFVRQEPLVLDGVAPPLSVNSDRSFLIRAVAFCVAGVPIGISGSVDEQLFFRWATDLWWMLPLDLRAIFGVGWNVTTGLTGDLSLSQADRYQPCVALFDPVHLEWRNPQTFLEDRGVVVFERDFRDEDLVVGNTYLREVFPWSEDGNPVLQPDPPLLTVVGENLPKAASIAARRPSVVGLKDISVLRRFRATGRRALDHARLVLVERWLAGEYEDPATLCLSPRDYSCDGSRHRLLSAAVQALAVPAGRHTAEQIISPLLLSGPSPELDAVLRSSSHPGTRRAKLMAAVSCGDSETVCAALHEAVQVDEAQVFEQALQEKIECTLDVALESAPHNWHAEMLLHPTKAGAYWSWVASRKGHLAITLAAEPTDLTIRALARLEEQHSAGFPALVLRWVRRQAPDPDDSARLSAAPAAEVCRFRDLVRDGWDACVSPGEREAILPWIRLVGSGQSHPSTSSIALGRNRLDASQLQRLSAEITAGQLPREMHRQVASIVLANWWSVSPHVQHDSPQWRAIFRLWPADVGLAVLSRRLPPDSEANLYVPIIEEPKFSEEDLERFVVAWAKSQLSDADKIIAARRLVSWIQSRANTSSSGCSSVALCAHLLRRELPGGADPGTERIVIAAELLRVAEADKGMTSEELWLWARDWQLQLLLELFPHKHFASSVARLEQLVPMRGWLRDHLQRTPSRRNEYAVAAYEFGQIPYPSGNPGPPWREEYSRSLLWAAYSAVPLDLQGDLSWALDIHAAGNPYLRIELAQKYLNASADGPRASFLASANRVWSAVVRRLADDAHLTAKELESVQRQCVGARTRSRLAFWRRRPSPMLIRPNQTFQDRPSSPLAWEGRTLVIALPLADLIARVARTRQRSADR